MSSSGVSFLKISELKLKCRARNLRLKEEDVILFFDGEEIFYSSDLPLTVGAIRPDTEVNAMVLRDGKKKTIQVTVGELPKDPTMAFNEPQQNILGIVVEDQTEGNDRPDQSYLHLQ